MYACHQVLSKEFLRSYMGTKDTQTRFKGNIYPAEMTSFFI